jgi:hypothetical protein
MIWDPKTKLVSPQFHVMCDDNFDTVQAPDPNIKQSDTMDRLFQTNRYTYDEPFGNEHTYLFTSGGANIHPDNLTPTIETCQTSFTTTSPSETQQHISADNTTRHKSILSMQDLMILHTNHIYPQSHTYDFKAYKHLHGIDMQTQSIPKSPQQKAQEMELSDLHHEEFRIFALEYNTCDTAPSNQFDNCVNTLQNITKTLIQESMICSLITWTPHVMPCKCKIPMSSPMPKWKGKLTQANSLKHNDHNLTASWTSTPLNLPPKSIYRLERDISTSYGRTDVNDARMDPSRNTKPVSV